MEITIEHEGFFVNLHPQEKEELDETATKLEEFLRSQFTMEMLDVPTDFTINNNHFVVKSFTWDLRFEAGPLLSFNIDNVRTRAHFYVTIT